LELARRMCADAGVKVELRPLVIGAPLELGALTVEAITAAHSIPDSCSLVITAHRRRVVHTGDLKLDAEARIATDLPRLSALGRAGIDLLVSDSTNAARAGRAGTEATVHRAVEAAILAC